ncbi:hypothetical protein MMC22_009885 [Lobaria immixta]|nr:hypothetical protein [Lobaria immixta]
MANPSLDSDQVPEPDLMNDPVFDTNSTHKQKSLEDADTCRICRGEGSKEEPLFYPCKCSGSIKFVHQNCLMEWLSHSQKKHCELCKTPFRFTKLYHPHMPNSVPLPVFLRQAAVHTWKTFLTWSRFHLVLFVWVAWLPWCMRTVFRGLFWIGDGAWINWQKTEERAVLAAQQQFDKLAAQGTSPASNQFLTSKDSSASALLTHMALSFPQFLSPVSQTLNFSAGEPTMLKLAKRMIMGVINKQSNESVPPSAMSAVNITNASDINQRSSSWLSEFRILRSLTSSPTLNNLVTDILEGQLITMLVVIAFILVFLIREWVVQQQPGLNNAAAPNANAADGQPFDALILEQAAHQRADHLLPHAQGNEMDVEGDNRGDPPEEPIRRPRIPRARRQPRLPANREQENRDQAPSSSTTRPESEEPPSASLQIDVSKPKDDTNNMTPRSRRTSVAGPSSSPRRPSMPSRSATARAAEIRRELEEQSQVAVSAGNNDNAKISTALEDDQSHQVGSSAATTDKIPLDTESKAVLESDQDRVEANKGPDPGLSSRSPQENNEYQSQASDDNYLHSDFPQNSGDQLSTMNTTEHRDSRKTSDPQTESSNDNPFHPDHSSNEPREVHELQNTSGADNTRELVADLPNQAENVELEVVNDGPLHENLLQGHPDIPILNHGLVDTVMNWLWGGVNIPMNLPRDLTDQQGGDDEHIVNDLADEAPFVPIERGQPVVEVVDNEENPPQDPEVVAAAVQAGLDPNGVEAVDDGEDLEGIMELVGMQGPLAGLIQNGMFCAVLVSLTIFLGMWIPYIAGKLFLVFLANPVSLLFKLPLRWASLSADLIIDLCVFGAGCAFYWVDTVVRFLCTPIGWIIPFLGPISQNKILAETAKRYAEGAMGRLARTFATTGDSLSESDIPTFSIIAHESLRLIEHRFASLTRIVRDTFIALLSLSSIGSFGFRELFRSLNTNLIEAVQSAWKFVIAKSLELIRLTPSLVKINPLRVSLNIPQRTDPLDFSLAYWDTKDRVLAIIFGYMFFSVIGVLYLRISASLRGRNVGGKVDGPFADVLYQAGGVMKVILIISIEMIAFPLYCGLLLDVALLPLFGHVTIMSRLNFLLASPNTSLFVHWFVGTCYMFHFALFVSMCRKIMRSGVLCGLIVMSSQKRWLIILILDFIRDPDDPTFHPVRDVLERSVSTQLRKIAFSALVYGALVILCLGGVVWGIYFTSENVFPIHWSSNEPVLEFPVDLLFYNFLMPVAVKFFNPSVGLNKMYNWWFRKCARALRLSNFLFGERKEDEEGHHVRRTWRDWLSRKRGDAQKPVIGDDRRILAEDRDTEVFFLRDGRYVLTPASDQVRIPKGVNTFLEVDENGARTDGLPESDQGLHSSSNDLFSKVYIPPFFRVRISLFILLIWVFAATTGVCITIIPLVFGRLVFANLIPNHRRMNDIYAFSIGLYLIGGAFYALVHYRAALTSLRASLSPKPDSNIAAILRQTIVYTGRLLRLVYTYVSFGILLPSLFSLVIEFYIVIPLHTYFHSPLDSHIIHFIQDWTLGVLYIKMAGRLILWYAPSRPAEALRGIVRHGWLNPDVRLATRSFIFPASLVMGVALTAPLSLGWSANKALFASKGSTFQAHVYRYSYPAVLVLGLWFAMFYLVGMAFRGWRQRIRDEVYLIGERLHNFGERKGLGTGSGVSGRRVTSRG